MMGNIGPLSTITQCCLVCVHALLPHNIEVTASLPCSGALVGWVRLLKGQTCACRCLLCM